MAEQESRVEELAKIIWRSCGRVRMPDHVAEQVELRKQVRG